MEVWCHWQYYACLFQYWKITITQMCDVLKKLDWKFLKCPRHDCLKMWRYWCTALYDVSCSCKQCTLVPVPNFQHYIGIVTPNQSAQTLSSLSLTSHSLPHILNSYKRKDDISFLLLPLYNTFAFEINSFYLNKV